MRRNPFDGGKQPETIPDLQELIACARDRRQTIVPRGRGHSYDAARNSHGMTLDLSLFQHIIDWNHEQGLITVEPGVTIDALVQTVAGSGWWPGVLPLKKEATLGGCLALNAHGINAWYAGSIGEHVAAFELLLPSGRLISVSLHDNAELFHSAIGGLGLLGVITSITLQLQPVRSGRLMLRRRFADSILRMFEIFREESPREGYLMGRIDGKARAGHIGSGIVLCADFTEDIPLTSPIPIKRVFSMFSRQGMFDRNTDAQNIPLEDFHFHFIPKNHLLHTIHPRGYYTFQAFVPARQAPDVFSGLLELSQQYAFVPLWCIMRQHRSDAFTLSSHVDGYSLELAYPMFWQNEAQFVHLLEAMLNRVIDANGKLHLAQDKILNTQTFRQMMGDNTVKRFLDIKKVYDGGSLFQSNLSRRLFGVE